MKICWKCKHYLVWDAYGFTFIDCRKGCLSIERDLDKIRVVECNNFKSEMYITTEG